MKDIIIEKNITITPSFFIALGLIFITLKLIGIINWSWWLILLPIYGPVALLLLFLTFIGLIILWNVKQWKDKI